MCDEARETNRMDGDTVDTSSSRAVNEILRLDRTLLLGYCGHSFCGGQRSTRRSVNLAIVMKLDDLGGCEMRCRNLGKPLHDNGADGEVRNDKTFRSVFRPHSFELRNAIIVKT